ncbi:hypothetical protein HMPREF2692_02520 [Corynebacterium sp. HMSC036D03]|nr:hypothetical protein HMPREF2692_02520 [Corynebacterium sp. HMSC036D03]
MKIQQFKTFTSQRCPNIQTNLTLQKSAPIHCFLQYIYTPEEQSIRFEWSLQREMPKQLFPAENSRIEVIFEASVRRKAKGLDFPYSLKVSYLCCLEVTLWFWAIRLTLLV